jgi:hypothetical protein
VAERDARAGVANRARELVERYGLGKEYRLVQEAHGRHLGSGDVRDLEDYRAASTTSWCSWRCWPLTRVAKAAAATGRAAWAGPRSVTRT